MQKDTLKQCRCTEQILGLPTIYPKHWNYCPLCGKPLEEITVEALKAEMRKYWEVKV